MDPNLRILIVDDVPAMRIIIRNMLTGMGFSRIEEADDGDSAWRMLRMSASDPVPFGLVVADWNMNAMSGVELLRAVRAFPPTRKLPFVIVTAQADREHLEEADQAEVTDYIVKPFGSDQLQLKIREALNRS